MNGKLPKLTTRMIHYSPTPGKFLAIMSIPAQMAVLVPAVILNLAPDWYDMVQLSIREGWDMPSSILVYITGVLIPAIIVLRSWHECQLKSWPEIPTTWLRLLLGRLLVIGPLNSQGSILVRATAMEEMEIAPAAKPS
jgi:hypothetical protein